MDLTRFAVLIIMLVPVVSALAEIVRLLDWRAAVQATHLRWEREQRQAGAAGIAIGQRQSVQMRFEELVSTRNIVRIGLNLVVGLLLAGFAVALAWEFDDLSWSGFWIVLPLGVLALLLLGYGWLIHSGGKGQLAATSASLYGPPPPRVKVRNIKLDESESKN